MKIESLRNFFNVDYEIKISTLYENVIFPGSLELQFFFEKRVNRGHCVKVNHVAELMKAKRRTPYWELLKRQNFYTVENCFWQILLGTGILKIKFLSDMWTKG